MRTRISPTQNSVPTHISDRRSIWLSLALPQIPFLTLIARLEAKGCFPVYAFADVFAVSEGWAVGMTAQVT